MKNKTQIVFRIKELEKLRDKVKEFNTDHGADKEIARINGEISGLSWVAHNEVERAKIFTNVIEDE